MNVSWFTPSAWWGLLALVVPIAIHLLTKQQTRIVRFPTLRFIRTTRLTALRRRSINDWLLLSVRILILSAAVTALASPLFVSAGRQAVWQTRVARAIILAPGLGGNAAEQAALVDAQRQGSFVSAVFRPAPHLADALRDAANWLTGQPPSLRETVIVGDLHEDALAGADVALLPATAGLRFVAAPVTEQARQRRIEFLEGESLWRADVSLDNASTRVAFSRIGTIDVPIRVLAPPVEQRTADAALNAVLARGVRLIDGSRRRVLVVFAGATAPEVGPSVAEPWMRNAVARLPEVAGAQNGETLVLNTPVHASGVEAARLLDRIVHSVFVDDVALPEPRTMSRTTLSIWTRPGRYDPGTPADEGDRRWLWAVVLVLLAVEAVARRSSRTSRAEPEQVESRVA